MTARVHLERNGESACFEPGRFISLSSYVYETAVNRCEQCDAIASLKVDDIASIRRWLSLTSEQACGEYLPPEYGWFGWYEGADEGIVQDLQEVATSEGVTLTNDTLLDCLRVAHFG